MTPNRNIRLLLAYDGTCYSGWQRQKDDVTIQGVLEDKLAVITRSAVTLIGAGRTDSGVHALGMVANFQTTATLPLDGLRKGLNSMLPRDIRILACQEAAPDFHSRFAALGKTYRYDFLTGEVLLPTERLYRVHIPYRLDIDAIHQCLDLLKGTHDFSSFEGSGSRDTNLPTGRGAVRTLHQARCLCTASSVASRYYSFYLSGDGFLRHMVRNLAGTLFEVGKGQLSAADFQRILAGRNRSLAGPTAPAHGLFLCRVYYQGETDELDFCPSFSLT